MNNMEDIKSKEKKYSSSISKLTFMLTKQCTLKCWMCDFGMTKELSKQIPLEVSEIIQILSHPIFKSLQTVTFTGGEPFTFPKILSLYRSVIEKRPDLCVNFSSNGTLLKPMIEVLDNVRNWHLINLLVSIDGIKKHDIQRGIKGSFNISIKNLGILKYRFPKLRILIKYTITPINYDELEKTFDYFLAKGYNFTAKLIENNPYYTNRISYNEHISDFSFTSDQLISIKTQLNNILKNVVRYRHNLKISEIQELMESLNSNWQRNKRCSTPREGAFIDNDLNFYSCKEYPPILNISQSTLDKLVTNNTYLTIIKHEQENTGYCTRCISQMRISKEEKKCLKFLKHFIH